MVVLMKHFGCWKMKRENKRKTVKQLEGRLGIEVASFSKITLSI